MSFYKRNLSHYQPIGYTYFITTRLTGTIPRHLSEKYKAEYETKLNAIIEIKNPTEKEK